MRNIQRISMWLRRKEPMKIAAMAAVALAGVACSTESQRSPSGDDEIKSFIAAYNDALNSGNAQQRWEMLCASQRQWLNANPVRTEQLEEVVPGHLEILEITVDGETATVVVDHIDQDQRESANFRLVHEDGKWKLCEK